jgi:hypothetical protein
VTRCTATAAKCTKDTPGESRRHRGLRMTAVTNRICSPIEARLAVMCAEAIAEGRRRGLGGRCDRDAHREAHKVLDASGLVCLVSALYLCGAEPCIVADVCSRVPSGAGDVASWRPGLRWTRRHHTDTGAVAPVFGSCCKMAIHLTSGERPRVKVRPEGLHFRYMLIPQWLSA